MLKYLFTCEYNDGTVFEQNEEDRSSQDPLKSAFFDIKHEILVKFTLTGNGHEYSVDLLDGHFEVDGVPFFMYEGELQNVRLVFFRRHRHTINTGEMEELSHIITYRIGWQANEPDGKNVQRIMEIA